VVGVVGNGEEEGVNRYSPMITSPCGVVVEPRVDELDDPLEEPHMMTALQVVLVVTESGGGSSSPPGEDDLVL